MSNARQIDPQLALDGRSPIPTDNPQADRGTIMQRGVIEPNTVINVPVTGDSFYFSALSDVIECAPVGKLGKQSRNPYFSGTGLRVNPLNWFKGLELFNRSLTEPLFYDLVAGFDAFIDNRLTYPNAQFKQVSVKIYDSLISGDSAVTVAIEDMSGTVITDDNGNEWYAVNRQLITAYNLSNFQDDIYILLTNTAASKGEGLAQPLTSAQFAVSGDFKAKSSTGAPIQGIISEIYNCLPKI